MPDQNIADIVSLLGQFYTEAEAYRWLTHQQQLLGDVIPLEMIAAGRADELVQLLRQMQEGNHL